MHTSAGVYTEKDAQGNEKPVTVRHGLGGGGQLTLMSTIGNEFSHEYGHDHGLLPRWQGPGAHSRNARGDTTSLRIASSRTLHGTVKPTGGELPLFVRS